MEVYVNIGPDSPGQLFYAQCKSREMSKALLPTLGENGHQPNPKIQVEQPLAHSNIHQVKVGGVTWIEEWANNIPFSPAPGASKGLVEELPQWPCTFGAFSEARESFWGH